METDTDLSDATERAQGMPECESESDKKQAKLPDFVSNIAEPLKGTNPFEKGIANNHPRTIQGVCVVDFVRCEL